METGPVFVWTGLLYYSLVEWALVYIGNGQEGQAEKISGEMERVCSIIFFHLCPSCVLAKMFLS